MNYTLVEIFSPWLATFFIFPFYLFLIVLAVWMFVWIGILCKLPRALGRFAAEVVGEYRSRLGG